VQPPIGAHGAEIRLRLQEIVDCPHETGETGIVRPRLAAYAAQASLYTEAIKNAMGGDCTNIAVLLQKHLKFCQSGVASATRVAKPLHCARQVAEVFLSMRPSNGLYDALAMSA
jgi:hypothetical protein